MEVIIGAQLIRDNPSTEDRISSYLYRSRESLKMSVF